MNILDFLLAFLIVLNLCILRARGFSIAIKSKTVTTKESEKFSPVPNLVNKNFFKKCDPCPKDVHCVPSIQCPAHVRMKTSEKPQICDLPHGGHGYCCTTGKNHTATHLDNVDKHDDKAKNSTKEKKSVSMERSSTKETNKVMTGVVEEARSHFSGLLNKESKTATVARDHPEFMHNLVFRSSQESLLKSIDKSHKAVEQVLASQIYKKREHIPSENFQLGSVRAFFDGTSLEGTCDQAPLCPPQPLRYRMQDGTCNHPDPAKAAWGAAGSPMERLLPPSYEDGIWEPRTLSVDGTLLRNPRTISRFLLKDGDRPHPTLNLLFMQFGQFITHDVTQSASITTADGRSVRCCSEDGSAVQPPEFMHYSCMPIVVEPEDEFYSQFRQGCINFVRSQLSPDNECRLNYGKQLSKVTHFIDASVIYGSDLKTQAEVRSFRGGRLRMLEDFGRELLPLTVDKEACVSLEKGPCFFTGDGRANQIISLTAVHILFAREHNRIADILSSLNPRWSDEIIFYETQRIVSAELQHISYKEWLPLLIGPDTMAQFGLNVQEHGYSHDYNPDINACITSEFSTAGMRFGHSIVDGKYIVHRGQEIDEIIDIPDIMFNPGRLRQRHFYDEILLSLTRQSMQQVDSAVTHGLSRYLFRGNNPFGLDLAAINIYRGREHGVRSYNDYVELAGHKRIHSFDEFGPDVGSKLNAMYNHPDDVDLWVGGLIEASKADSVLGPTFSNIVADQFSRFRQGDRYFYEHSPEINPGAFTPAQLQEIKKISIARLICDNSDNIQWQSPNAFIRPDIPGNSPISCANTQAIPTVNLFAWQEI